MANKLKSTEIAKIVISLERRCLEIRKAIDDCDDEETIANLNIALGNANDARIAFGNAEW